MSTITINDLPQGQGAEVMTDADAPCIGQTRTPAESLAMHVLRMSKAQAIRTQYGTPCATLTGQLLDDLLHPEALGLAVTPEMRDRARACLNMQTCESTRRAS